MTTRKNIPTQVFAVELVPDEAAVGDVGAAAEVEFAEGAGFGASVAQEGVDIPDEDSRVTAGALKCP